MSVHGGSKQCPNLAATNEYSKGGASEMELMGYWASDIACEGGCLYLIAVEYVSTVNNVKAVSPARMKP